MKKLTMLLRGIFAHKQNAFFSLVSLGIGISCVTVISLWSLMHLSFDRFHDDAEYIYFVQNTDTLYNETDIVTPFELAKELRERISGMENSATITFWPDQNKVEANGKELFVRITSAEPQLLDILSFDFIGNTQAPQLSNSDIALSSTLANKLFGTTNCIGQQIIVQDSVLAQVCGVYHDFPPNSTIRPEAVCNYALNEALFINCEGWHSWCYATLVKANKNVDIAKASEDVTKILSTEHEISELFSFSPLLKYHLTPFDEPSKMTHLIMVFFAGLLVLIISCINFVNLQIAISYKRFKQNSIKKMLGATSSQLIKENIFETGIYIFVALCISLLFTHSFAPYLAQRVGMDIISVMGIGTVVGIHLLIAAIVFIVLALIISFNSAKNARSYQTIAIAVKTTKLNKASKRFVIVQLSMAIIIGISAFVMQQQLNFMIDSDKGYNAERLMHIDTWDYPFEENEAAIVEYLNQNPFVESYSVCEGAFNRLSSRTTGFSHPEWSDSENDFYKVMYRTDENLLNTTQIELEQGRFFEPDKYNEKHNIVINETYANMLGGVDKAMNMRLTHGGEEYQVVGVCKDFYFETFRTRIEPLVMLHREDWICHLLIKAKPGVYGKVMSGIEQFLKEKSGAPFQLTSMQQLLHNLYQAEESQKTMISLLCILAIIISCLGLIGLSSFIIENMTKEIGIRKVNGAKVSEILMLLNRDFVLWVAIAIIVACPFAWFIMSKWLDNFAYKTELSWWIFAIAGTIALAIALITVSLQSWRAARKNPVEALRYE